MKGNVPNAKVLENQACFSSDTTSEKVQEEQVALSSIEVVLENKNVGHQLENDNLSSDEPHRIYSVDEFEVRVLKREKPGAPWNLF